MSGITWWRSWHGAPTDHKWAVIAARSGVKTGVVIAVAWALLDYASQQEERGSVVGFDPEEFAIFSGFTEDEITAVIQAMNDKEILKDGRFVNWEKRQPKREDDSTERVRKYREEKRNVTQGNAPERESESDTESEEDKEKEREESNPQAASPLDPFDAIKDAIESRGIMLSGEADIKTVTELVKDGVTPEDILAGFQWKATNNGGKVVRYLSAIVGPVKTAKAKRVQTGFLPPPKTRKLTGPNGEIVYEEIR
jgi:hypothetical protein